MTISRVAPAKINLTLEVLGKRPDGYHDICSVLQTIDLHDTLTFAPAGDLEFTCNVPQLASHDNLVVRAAQTLRAATGYAGGAAIHLEKRIPLASGLGGGSSDAAATLKALCQLWGLEGLAFERLIEIGTQLGMDVPFFLYGGTALARGRGEIVTPLPPAPDTWLVLLHPDVEVEGKTAKMYASLSPADYTPGDATNQLVETIRRAGLLQDNLLFNVFESVAKNVFHSMSDLRQRFAGIVGRPVHMSGAGPTLFCLADDAGHAGRIRDQLVAEGIESYASKTVPQL